MAKVFGEAGKYVTEEATKRSDRLIVRILVMVSFFGFVAGWFPGSMYPIRAMPEWVHLAMPVGAVAVMFLVTKISLPKLKDLSKERENMRKGAVGEHLVGQILSDLPDKFRVINDFPTAFGNLDHIVIGPTGVFVLETKNWRGIVSSDGRGELLLNGKATEKPVVKTLVGRMMGIREKVRVLAPKSDLFYQTLVIFTAARVEAKWGTTGHTNCLADGELRKYVLERKVCLSQIEVHRLAEAFCQLACMDQEFSRAA